MVNEYHPNDLYFCTELSHERLLSMMGQKTVVMERFVLLLSVGGEVRFEIDGKNQALNPNQFLLVFPRQETIIKGVDSGVSLRILGFMPALQDVVTKQFNISFFAYVHSNPLWQLNEREQSVVHSFYDLFDYNSNVCCGSFSTEIANSLFSIFMQIFHHRISGNMNKTITHEPASLVTCNLSAKFFQLLSLHYKQEHSVSFYADKLCVSSKYLAQVIKSFSTYTPKEIIDRRLGQESVFMLTKTYKNIQEISIELGFPDQSYFGRFFKRMFGVSPLHYRMNPDMNLLDKLSGNRMIENR